MVLRRVLGVRAYRRFSEGFNGHLDLSRTEWIGGQAAIEMLQQGKRGEGLTQIAARFIRGLIQHDGIGNNLRGDPVIPERKMARALRNYRR